MKKLMLLTAVLSLMVGCTTQKCIDNCCDDTCIDTIPAISTATTSLWLTDFEAAKALAVKNGTYCIVKYGATSGCGQCLKANKNVFDKPEFINWATENKVALLFVDKNNTALKTKIQKLYGLQVKKDCKYSYPNSWSWPTILILGGATGDVYEGSFLCRSGVKTSKGTRLVLNPAGVQKVINSYCCAD